MELLYTTESMYDELESPPHHSIDSSITRKKNTLSNRQDGANNELTYTIPTKGRPIFTEEEVPSAIRTVESNKFLT